MKQDASPQDTESGEKLGELLAKQEERTLHVLYAEYTAKARHTGSLVWVIGAVFIPLSLSGLALALHLEDPTAGMAATALSAALILLWLFISEVLHIRFNRDATIRALIESHLVSRADRPFTRGLEDLMPIRLPVRRARWIITGVLLLLCIVSFWRLSADPVGGEVEMTQIQQLQVIVPLAKDVLTAVSAVFVAIIGWYGLQTWKKQLTGKTEYELARRLLRAVLEVRGAVVALREPLILPPHRLAAMEAIGLERDPKWGPEEYEKAGRVAVIVDRWNGVRAASQKLDQEAFEAEVLWGPAVRERLKPLRKVLATLFAHVYTSVSKFGEPMSDETLRVLYANSKDPSKDSFACEVEQSVECVERFLRPHVRL